MSTSFADTRYAVRQLIKSPGFAVVAVLSLALGIGVNTAIFSLLNAVWMRSLPVRDPHALRVVNWSGRNAMLSNFMGSGMTSRDGARISGSFPYPVYRDFKERAVGCSEVFAFTDLSGQTVIAPTGAVIADALMVSGDFFAGYGVQTQLGRTLLPSDESSQADPVAVITYRWWDRHYDLDPAVLGQIITVNQQQFTIVGVLPRSYCGPLVGDRADIYVPMSAQPHLCRHHPLDARDHWWVQIMARLAPGAEPGQVAASMEGIFLQTLSAPGQKTRMEDPHIVLEDGSRGPLMIRRRMIQPLSILMGAVGLVLLIACANLAGLLLARGAARRQELTVRTALGAGRWRLVRQLLTESLVLSLGGAVLGILVAVWVKTAIVSFLGGTGDRFNIDVVIDLRVLGFAMGAALLTSLLFGLLPALRSTRVDLSSSLKGTKVLGVPGLRLGKVLVAAQVGLSVLLVFGTGLLLQSLVNLYRVDPGFRTENLLVFSVNPSQADYSETERIQFYDNVQTAIAGLPGVQHVALASSNLLAGNRSSTGFSIPGRQAEPDQHLQADVLDVSGSFFRTMDIPLLRGRAFEVTDTPSQARVIIINETFARTFFPGEDPLGRSIHMGDRDYQIVGLCGDAKYDRIQRDIEPMMYFAHRQNTPGAMCFQVGTAHDALSLVPAIRAIVTDLDRSIPLNQISTQTHLLKRSIMPERLFATLCGGLAALGIGLSCIGLYGLLAFMVTRRTGEIGVRMALGARPRDVAWPVLRSALWLAGFGLLVGIPLALALARVLRSVLFDIAPHDPLTIAGAVVLILAIAALAAWLPARRAAKIDPMEALRYE